MSAFGVDRPVSETKTAPGQTDLPEHAGERDRHPECLLAVVAPLQRPARVDHRAVRRHAPRQAADRVWLHARYARGPRSRLRYAVGLSHEVAAEGLEAYAVTRKKIGRVEPFGYQRMREPQ